MSAREANKNARRQAILQAAQALILEGKTRDFSMPNLAKRAGVSLVTPYNLFGSKSNILLEIVRADVLGRTSEIDSLPSDDIVEWAESASRIFARAYFRGRHFYRCLTTNLVTQESGEGFQEILKMMYQSFVGSLTHMQNARKIRRTISIATLAQQMARGVMGSIQHCLMDRVGEEKYHREIHTGILLMLAGVARDDDRGRLLERAEQLK